MVHVMANSPYEKCLQGILVGCIDQLGLGICFDEHNYHDSLQARLIERIGHYASLNQI